MSGASRWLAACATLATAVALADVWLAGISLVALQVAPPLLASIRASAVGTALIGGLSLVLAALLVLEAGLPAHDATGRLTAVAVTAPLAATLAMLRRRTERAAENAASAQRRTAAMMEAAIDSIVTMDIAGRVLDWNPAAERTFGYTREEAVGRELAELIIPQPLRARHRAGLANYRETGEGPVLGQRLEMTAMRADGSEFPVELTVTRADSSGPPVFAGYVRDVSARVMMEKRLAHQALHDPLTGLANRKLCIDLLDRALSRARRSGSRTAVLFLDLDGFKDVNDTLGHQAGDRVLQTAASRLVEWVRPSDTVARFGGDEFAIVCEGVSVDEGVAIAERLHHALEAPVSFAGEELTVSSSIGLAFSEAGGGTPQSLLSEADAAMYNAKQRGWGNVQVFAEDMRPHAAEHHTMEGDLRRALKNRELRVLYQPVVDVVGGDLVGVEALVRWDHPERGRLAPAEFIPFAEEAGLIDAVGEFVLREACLQAKRWLVDYPDGGFAVTVNCSPSQLRDGDLPGLVADVLQTSGIRPDTLWLDLTERALVGSTASQSPLNLISDMGVCIAIDDFGSGYSSLAHLQRLPVAAVKVDRSLIDAIDRSKDDSAVVTAMIEMAHALDLGVVAEGVERQEQAWALRESGCDRAQGYLFGPPGEPEHVDALLAEAA